MIIIILQNSYLYTPNTLHYITVYLHILYWGCSFSHYYVIMENYIFNSILVLVDYDCNSRWITGGLGNIVLQAKASQVTRIKYTTRFYGETRWSCLFLLNKGLMEEGGGDEWRCVGSSNAKTRDYPEKLYSIQSWMHNITNVMLLGLIKYFLKLYFVIR